jgi:HPt (histidine-containing phosphotransfer) domain-containing protein
VSPIDLQALDRIRALGRSGVSDLAGKIVRLYLAGSARLVQEIRDAVGRHDAAALREAAHTLRSSSASVGALGLAALCADLEALGRSERVEEASRRLDELAAEHQAVREALTRELDARPVPPAGRPG